MTSTRQRGPWVQWSRWLWIGYWLALFVATHLRRVPDVTFGVRHGDKLLHFLLYLLLTLLGGMHLRASRRTTPATLLLGWALVYAAYGIADEWLQQFVGRSTALGDWIADVLGVAVATLVLLRAPREAKLSEPGEAVR